MWRPRGFRNRGSWAGSERRGIGRAMRSRGYHPSAAYLPSNIGPAHRGSHNTSNRFDSGRETGRGGAQNFESKKLVRVGQTMYEKKGSALFRVGTSSESSAATTTAQTNHPIFPPRRVDRGYSRPFGRGLRARRAQFKPFFSFEHRPQRFGYKGNLTRGRWRGYKFGASRGPSVRGRGTFFRGRVYGLSKYSRPYVYRGGPRPKHYFSGSLVFRSKKFVRARKNDKLPKSLQAPRSWVVTIGGIRFRKDPNRNTLTRILPSVADPSISHPHSDTAAAGQHSSAEAAGVVVTGHAARRGVPATVVGATATAAPQRVRIGGAWYEKSADGQTLSRLQQNKTLNLKRERLLAQLAAAREKRRADAEARRREAAGSLCTFFTRLGRCARSNCPFKHDPDRVAVCRLFLRGLCTGGGGGGAGACPFSHSVAPERMPACQHFLRGTCTREDCPYRHIRADPADKSDPLLMQPERCVRGCAWECRLGSAACCASLLPTPRTA